MKPSADTPITAPVIQQVDKLCNSNTLDIAVVLREMAQVYDYPSGGTFAGSEGLFHTSNAFFVAIDKFVDLLAQGIDSFPYASEAFITLLLQPIHALTKRAQAFVHIVYALFKAVDPLTQP